MRRAPDQRFLLGAFVGLLDLPALEDFTDEPAEVVPGAIEPAGAKALSLGPVFSVMFCGDGLSLPVFFGAVTAANSSANILAFALLDIAAKRASAAL